MADDENIFHTSIMWIITVVTIGFIGVVGEFMVGVYLYPIFMQNSFIPAAGTQGVSANEYTQIAGNLYQGLKWFFYILIAIPFVWLAIRLLYKKESLTVKPDWT